MSAFRTVCDEETMRLSFPGQTLYNCADCQRRVCLFEDLDATSDSGSDFVCPKCQARRNDVGRRIDHSAVSAFCLCPACCAARTPEGVERIKSYNVWVTIAIPQGLSVVPASVGKRWFE